MSDPTPDAAPAGEPEAELESQIGRWRGYVQGRQVISAHDVEELETHLRDQVADLRDHGLAADEAFLVAVKRLGSLDEVSREFAQEHSERLWKQLVLNRADPEAPQRAERRELVVVIGLAVAAAVAFKVPVLFGQDLADPGWFYARNLALFALPFLAAYFAWKRRMGLTRALTWLVPPFLVGAVVANAYPYVAGGSTEALVAVHLPVALWFAVGVAYVAGQWQSSPKRMDFIRFTGEWVVYYALLALGGGVLVALTGAGFTAIGLNPEVVLFEWVLPCGALGAVVVAAWLVEAKQNVVENIAPVLTRVFTPLATLMVLAYLVALLLTDDLFAADRELLILVDLILVLVLGLVLYAISARDPYAAPSLFDRLQLVLVLAVLAVDVVMLAAMTGRIAEFGASPNKVAALGLNLVLLVNLGWSARLLVDHRGHAPFAALERWQTTYLPAFAAWAKVVVVVFPPAFGWE